MSWGVLRSRLSSSGVVALSLAALGCATVTAANSNDATMSSFQKELADFEQRVPKPFPCSPGFASNNDGYLLTVAEPVARAGLRIGDRITSVGSTPTTTREERRRAFYQIPEGGPVIIGVSRHGKVATVSLPCRDDSSIWTASKGVLAAGARGDWDACVDALAELRRARGFTYSGDIWNTLSCHKAKGGLGKGDEAQLVYESTRLLIEEVRYVPGGLDGIRGTVLRNASYLRANNLPSLAFDLETRLPLAESSGQPAR